MFANTSTCRSGEGGALWFRYTDPDTGARSIMQTQWPTVVRKFHAFMHTVLGLAGTNYFGWGEASPDVTMVGAGAGGLEEEGVVAAKALERALRVQALERIKALEVVATQRALTEEEGLELRLASMKVGWMPVTGVSEATYLDRYLTGDQQILRLVLDPALPPESNIARKALEVAKKAAENATDFFSRLRAGHLIRRASDLTSAETMVEMGPEGARWSTWSDRTRDAKVREAAERVEQNAEVYETYATNPSPRKWLPSAEEVAAKRAEAQANQESWEKMKAWLAQKFPDKFGAPAVIPGVAFSQLGDLSGNPFYPLLTGDTGGSATHQIPWPAPSNCLLGMGDIGSVTFWMPDAAQDTWSDASSAALLWLLCQTGDVDAASRLMQWNVVKGPMPSDLLRFVLWFAGFIPPLSFQLVNPPDGIVVPDMVRARGGGIEIQEDTLLPLWTVGLPGTFRPGSDPALAENPADVGWWAQSPVNEPLPNPPSVTGRLGTFRAWPVAADVLPRQGAAKGTAPASSGSGGRIVGTGVKAAIVYYGLKWLFGG